MDNKTNQVTNKELQDLLKQYPDEAIVEFIRAGYKDN